MNTHQAFALIRFKVWAELRAERERTYLGFVWWLLEPLMFMSIFYVIFGLVRGKGGADYVAFLLVGLVTWQWFRACVSHSGASVMSGLALMRQIRLPPALFPLIVIATDTVKFFFVLALLLLVLLAFGIVSATWIALPVILLVQLLFIVACCLPYAALVPFIPDLRHVVDTLLLGVMFLSGIFYGIDSISEPYQSWIRLNPMANLIESSRAVLLHDLPPNWTGLLAIACGSILAIAGSSMLLGRLGPRYTKLPK